MRKSAVEDAAPYQLRRPLAVSRDDPFGISPESAAGQGPAASADTALLAEDRPAQTGPRREPVTQLHDPFALPAATTPFDRCDDEGPPPWEGRGHRWRGTWRETPQFRASVELADNEPELTDVVGDPACCPPLRCLAGDGRLLLRSLAAALAAFGGQTLWHMLRTPWRSASYKRDEKVLGVEYKDALVITWTLAYFLGKVVSAPLLGGLRRHRRLPLLLLCACVNLVAMAAFAILPQGEGSQWADYARMGALALSSFPLTFTRCTVFRYLEGRDYTDFLGAVMSGGIIIGPGAAKSAGSLVTDLGVSEETMPIVVGGCAFPLLLLDAFLLDALPEPSVSERSRRGDRPPMTGKEQWAFFSSYWPGLVALMLSCMTITALRDFRDAFLPDMWQEMNDGDSMPSALYTITEVIISVVVLSSVALVSLVEDNRVGFAIILGYCTAGCALLAAIQFAAGELWESRTGQAVWITATGVGIFYAYVPLSAVVYDRLIGALGEQATSVFIISLSDALGYCGSVGLLLFRNYYDEMETLEKHEFFRDSSRFGGAFAVLCYITAGFYFRCRGKPQVPEAEGLL
eukprot:TRINITY_DN4676_c0_g1_i2.p1 TRINITY_DN4676_c0_g1~~TRINITY_DN4676_c0_g1_i2.p1  ORF type:complete len:601 (+),score=181.92 TRINITY_DN4676_c0_g1_i2:82-1803(+)